jgi:hypothetical protein
MVFITARVPEETAMAFENGEAQVRNVEVSMFTTPLGTYEEWMISADTCDCGGQMFCSRQYTGRRAQDADQRIYPDSDS